MGRESDTLRAYFGSLPRSIFTCFKAIQGGIDWDFVAIALSDLHWFYVAVFVLQIVFVNLAVLNVISGLFLQSALEQAQADLDDVIANHANQKLVYVQRFKKVFESMDVDGDEIVSLKEFQNALNQASMI